MTRQLKTWVYIVIGLIAVIVLLNIRFIDFTYDGDYRREKVLSNIETYQTAFKVYNLYETRQKINLNDLCNYSNCNAQLTKELIHLGHLEIGSNDLSVGGEYLDPWGNPYHIELKRCISSNVSNIVYTGAYDLIIRSSRGEDKIKKAKK